MNTIQQMNPLQRHQRLIIGLPSTPIRKYSYNMNIETIEKICKDLPHVHVEIKWKSDLVYMIAKKMFCVVDLEAVPTSVAFKVPNDDFDEIATQTNFKPAPYFAQHKWVTVVDIDQISIAELRKHITKSYELVKAKLSKKALRDLDD